jgi:hypothetical protein
MGTRGYSHGCRSGTGVRGCCGTAEGPRVAVLSCAGAYAAGAAGSNECPAGSVRIETQASCRTAAAAVGKTFGSTSVDADYPKGCYIWTTFNTAYFNPHAVGAGEASSRLLCALATTTGAPPRAPRGSAGPAGVRLVWDGTVHRVLTGYSAGLAGNAAVGHVLRAVAVRTCRAE